MTRCKPLKNILEGLKYAVYLLYRINVKIIYKMVNLCPETT